ncbi:unnamed protein product [Leptosia nina]|uniref:Uncharacterized protein n=1 Tax=Leptosia nina TaxID=320188 RepID=A0AAV1K1E9_9NEOP
MIHHKIDIALISEAHCNSTSNVKIKGHKVYFTTHPDGTAHAGTAIIIHDNIKHHIQPEFKTSYDSDNAWLDVSLLVVTGTQNIPSGAPD